MSTPTPNDHTNKAVSGTSSAGADLQGSSAVLYGTLSPQSREEHATALLSKLLQYDSISDQDYQFIATQIANPSDSGVRLRTDLFQYILRAEGNFLQFIDVHKPLPLGLRELLKIDAFITTDLAPGLSPEQRLAWLKRGVSHLSYLGSYPSWGPSHLEQLHHAALTLTRLRTSELLPGHADIHTQNEFQFAFASVFQRASECCTDISLYPTLYEALRDLTILPGHLLSDTVKKSILSLYTALRDFLPTATRHEPSEEEPTFFIAQNPYTQSSSSYPVEDDEQPAGWEIDLPKNLLEQILDESTGGNLTEDELHKINEAQFAFSAMTQLCVYATAALASLSQGSDCAFFKDLCYTHSFYEPEWLHYVRGLARADHKRSVLIGVVADLLGAAAVDTQAMQQVIGLVAAELLLEEPANQRVLQSLRQARHALNHDLRLKIRNRLWATVSGYAHKTSNISGIPMDKALFFEASKQILARVYPEEAIGQRKQT